MILSIDTADRDVLVAALDVFQRVAMGQWRAVVEFAPVELLGAEAGQQFGRAADEIMAVRSVYAVNPALRHKNTSLGIAQAGDQARRACDLWHLLGGGMLSRQDDRLTDTHATLQADPFGIHGTLSDGHGTEWQRCSPDCDLHVVRPGVSECSCADEVQL